MPATRQSWSKLQPLPENRARLFVEREFSNQEYDQLCSGFIPERMEDKWFIFAEEDLLYFHRSWTGFCIFQLRLERKDAAYRVGEVFANRDAKQYIAAGDAFDEKLLTFLIDSLLLNRRSPLPIASNIPAGIETDLHVLHVAGAGQRAQDRAKELTISGILGWLWHWLVWLIKGIL